MIAFFHLTIYTPLYNALVFLIGTLPNADVGVAVIVLTVLVKLILFPLSQKAVRAQAKMKDMEKPLAKIKEQYKDNKEELARQTMSLYKKYQVNPFLGFVLILVQIPIIFSLYYVFFKGGLPIIDQSLLYNFIKSPDFVNMHFLGFMDISKNQWTLALLAAITQFFQAKFSFPKETNDKPKTDKSSFMDDMARNMRVQVKYVLPVMVFFFAWNILGAVALYWAVSNIFAIGQELYIRHRIKKDKELNPAQI